MAPASKNLRETNLIGSRITQRSVNQEACPPLGAAGIHNVGRAWISDRYEVVRVHPDFEHLTVCIQGEGLSLVNGSWVPWRKGTAVLSPFHACHGAQSLMPGAKSDTPWVIAWVTFSTSTDHSETARLAVSQPTQHPGDHSFLYTLIEGLEHELLSGNEPAALFHWAQLIASFSQRLSLGGSRDSRLQALWQSVENSLSSPWTLEEMARSVHMSEAHLRRLCRREQGFGPSRQLANLRIKRASMLLKQTSKSVDTIASEVGYSDAFAFSTAFRRVTGFSPRQFRQSAS